MKKYVFGVDIGGTAVKIGLFFTNGILLENWEIKTRIEDQGAHVLPDIADAVLSKCKEKNIDKEEIAGIGMGVPGPVTDDGVVHKCVNLGWGEMNVVKYMEELTGLPVRAGNDANVAALGESWQGGGKGFQDLVMVTLGTGVGGGIIIGGKVLTGSGGAAGEIGHIPVNPEEKETCGCGNHGCLEQYASANGIVLVAKRYLEAHKDQASSLRELPSFTSKEIFDAAKAGDHVADQITDFVCDMLGRAMATISVVTNPEAFVIGGGMSAAGTILIEKIQKSFQRYAFHLMRETQFKFATLGNKAGIYGSAKLVL